MDHLETDQSKVQLNRKKSKIFLEFQLYILDPFSLISVRDVHVAMLILYHGWIAELTLGLILQIDQLLPRFPVVRPGNGQLIPSRGNRVINDQL